MTGLSPEACVIGDVDSSDKDDVLCDFGSIGLWERLNDTTPWNRLTSNDPEDMVVGNVDGN